jgi:hypothetical protein
MQTKIHMICNDDVGAGGFAGGACGYGPLVDVKPLKARVSAVSPVLFKKGQGCGECFKVKCKDKSICSRRAVTVIVTDECPGGPCGNGNTHFDLSGAAFGRMAIAGEGGSLRNRGQLQVVYRRYVYIYICGFLLLLFVCTLYVVVVFFFFFFSFLL